MMDSLVGCFAKSKAGHDKMQLYVITAQEGDFVSLCDGRLKTVENPKQKRRKHIQPISCKVEASLFERLVTNKQISNEEIKYAIKKYLKQEQL